ncbi:tautomerase family protein [Sinomonas terrae]|uniref:Tautomerase family protein n=1 Tax=Sinomonas terrae TaxID=2908838 RepID=A0ABS9TVU2_9MICC|nr:tautomerase family protein [Sinomonas terrae]MCH6468546.1 tautomerase family protein [Sinomonas terrae]
MKEGRERARLQLRALISALHKAAQGSVEALRENMTVIIREVATEHWSKADVTIAERDALRNASHER